MSENMQKPKITQEEEDEIESLTKSLVMRDKMKLPGIGREVRQQRPERLPPGSGNVLNSTAMQPETVNRKTEPAGNRYTGRLKRVILPFQ